MDAMFRESMAEWQARIKAAEEQRENAIQDSTQRARKAEEALAR